MNIKQGFVLKHVAGKHIVVPVGDEAVNFNGLITLNDSGVLLFDALKKKVTIDDLVHVMTDRYDIDEKTAKDDVLSFIEILRKKKLIEE